MISRTRLAIAITAVLAILLASCGQKPGVHRFAGSQGQFAGQTSETGSGELAPGDPAATAGEAAGTAAATGGTAAESARQATQGAGTSGPVTADRNDRIGVTKDRILLGFHAPLTGAAAVDLTDLKYGNTVFPRWLQEEKGVTIHGRRVDVIFRDDKYNPSEAVSVCRDMVEKQKVFLLIGGAGTDQIQACARYAHTVKVPYISAGVTENVLNKLPNYLAFTQTYPDQVPALIKLIKTFDAGSKGGKVLVDRCAAGSTGSCVPGVVGNATPSVAIVYSDTQGFHDARDVFLREWGGPVKSIPITKGTISASAAETVISQLRQDGIDVVFLLSSPANFSNLLTPAEGQQYRPRWVGVGITKGLNLVAAPACARQRSTFEHSIFFSPWFSVDHPDAQQWKAAWTSKYGPPDPQDREPTEVHDIAFGLWGGSIIQNILLNAAGPDLTRSGFINSALKLKNATVPLPFVKDIYTPLTFSPTDRFGSDSTHILVAQCDGAGHFGYFERNGKLLTTKDL